MENTATQPAGSYHCELCHEDTLCKSLLGVQMCLGCMLTTMIMLPVHAQREHQDHN